jgi:3-dehydroquinate synthase
LKKIIINTGSHKSEILVGEDWRVFSNLAGGRSLIILTDDNLRKFYGNEFGNFPVISLAPGESSKKLQTIEMLAGKLLDLGADRNSFIVGIGGGVVCDIAGFLASVYMRGISFGFVSTSLLSQVDASVGGKNGVNFGTVKNIIGTFNQPDFVICDPGMLKTLPEDEFLSGLAELIKHGAIADADLFRHIEENTDRIRKRDIDFMSDLIGRSVEIKAEVVRDDEKEKGRRMILNFGHTFGHAIEAHTGMKHGFAVAAGMKIAADISVNFGMFKGDKVQRITDLLNKTGLILPYDIDAKTLGRLIESDKKKSGGSVSFIMLEAIGKTVIRKVAVSELIEKYISIYSKR